MKDKIWLSWSSGKDSAWTLHTLREKNVQVEKLFCTVNQVFDRVTMHGTRIDVLKAQAKAANLPLELITIPNPCSNEDYQEVMTNFVKFAKDEGVTTFAFGDIFLEDVRQYRENNLQKVGMKSIFPLWGKDPKSLCQEMIAGGLKAKISCLDPRKINRDLAGHDYGDKFLKAISENNNTKANAENIAKNHTNDHSGTNDESIDPCGENGEFHTVAYQGPMFNHALNLDVGETVERDGFVFTDLILKP